MYALVGLLQTFKSVSAGDTSILNDPLSIINSIPFSIPTRMGAVDLRPPFAMFVMFLD